MSRNIPTYTTSYTNARPQRTRSSKYIADVELVDRERRFTILVLVTILFMFVSIPFVLMYKRKRAKSKPSIVAPNVLGNVSLQSNARLQSNDAVGNTTPSNASSLSNTPATNGLSNNAMTEIPMPTVDTSNGLLDKNKLHNIIDNTDRVIQSFY